MLRSLTFRLVTPHVCLQQQSLQPTGNSEKRDSGVDTERQETVEKKDGDKGTGPQTQTQNPVVYREAKTLLHSRYNGDWKKQNGGYQAHLDPIWRLQRAQQTTIFRMRTGYCGLSAHLKRIGISDTSLCECGQADQTPDHVLQSCPRYVERRQLTWPQGADLTTKLWGSAEDLYRTVGFVASTELKI